MIQQLGYNNPGQTIGPISVSDNSGGVTYYPDYTSAIKAAKTGEVVHQLANIVESNPVTIIISKSITINLNGFTYLHKNVTGGFSVTSAITLTFMNGIIQSSVATAILSISHVSAEVIYNGGKIVGNVNMYGTLTNALIYGTLTCNSSNTWVVRKVTSISSGGNSFNLNGGLGFMYNCLFIANGGSNSFTTGNGSMITSYSTTFVSTAYTAVSDPSSGANFTTYNCSFISSASCAYALIAWNNSGSTRHTNATVISTASYAISCNASKFYNSFLYSSANSVMGAPITVGGSISDESSNNTFYNCTLIATTSPVIQLNANSGLKNMRNSFFDSHIECQWNNVGGYCLANVNYVVSCFIKTTNFKAFGIISYPGNANPTKPYITRNIFQGMEKEIHDNVILRQTNQIDLYGNILLN